MLDLKANRWVHLSVVVLFGIGSIWQLFSQDGPPRMERLYDEPPTGAVRVLFIGDDHTTHYDLPGQLQHLGAAAGQPIWVEHVTAADTSLADHWEDRATRAAITDTAWDFVVLQNDSVQAVDEPTAFVSAVGHFSKLAARQGATAVLMETWAPAHWNQLYDQQDRSADTPMALRKAVGRIYHRAEAELDVHIAPVSTAWWTFRRHQPGVALHDDDGDWATVAGAYLSACVLFDAVIGQRVAGNSFAPEDMAPRLATDLQNTADTAAAHWVDTWRRRRESQSRDVESSAGQRPRSALEILRKEEPQ